MSVFLGTVWAVAPSPEGGGPEVVLTSCCAQALGVGVWRGEAVVASQHTRLWAEGCGSVPVGRLRPWLVWRRVPR